MLKKEIGEAEAGAAAREKLLSAASKAKKEKETSLAEFKASSEAQAASMKATLASERAVQVEQSLCVAVPPPTPLRHFTPLCTAMQTASAPKRIRVERIRFEPCTH